MHDPARPRWALLLLAAVAFDPGLPLGATPLFHDATAESGLLWSQMTWGAQAVDVDLDGDLDLFSCHHFSSAYLHTNLGSGQFTVWGLPQIVNVSGDRHGGLFADLDGDGFPEAFSTHGGEGGCAICPSDPSELWRSLGGGLFALVSGAGGMADTSGRGRAASAADIDGDGDLDVHVTKAPLAGHANALYRNDGGLSFVDVAAEWGVDEVSGSVGSLFGDVDDDGDPDLLVGGEEFARPTSFFRNEGEVFVEATASTFGELPMIAGADLGDYDGDRDLDLVLCEGADAIYDVWGADGTKYWFFANHRFSDDGVDAFTFRTTGVNPVASFRHNGTVDNPVIFLGPNGVHPAGGNVTLTDAYVGAPSFIPGSSLGLYCWRESPGGVWQVRVSAPPGTYGNFSGEVLGNGAILDPAGSQLEQPALTAGRVIILRNDGSGFTDVTFASNVSASVNPRGVTWVDIDDDGDLDIHLVNKGTAEIGNELDRLWRNDGGVFSLLAGEVAGISDHLSDGGTWGDFDGDGDVDLFLQEGAGPHYFSLGAPSIYYRNDGAPGHSLRARLRAAGGLTAVGARVTAYAGSLVVHRRVQANSWRGFQLPEELHFGLGAADHADSLVIEWPSGTVDRLFGLPADQAVGIDEGALAVGLLHDDVASFDGAGPIHPQPGRASQRIRLTAQRSGVLRVGVFDVSGRLVRSLWDANVGSGSRVLEWDGCDESGRPVPAGVYFWRGSGVLEFERRAIRLR